MTKKKTIEFELPGWIPEDAWHGYIEMRKEIKKPPTDYAVTLLLKKLSAFKEKGHELEAVLEQSIINNWVDVYPPKLQSRMAQASQDMSRAAQTTIANLQQYLENES